MLTAHLGRAYLGPAKRATAAALRRIAARFGITALRTRNQPCGVDWLHDVERISRHLGFAPAVFFDVGANDGTVSRQILAAFPAARVHAFEPNPALYRELRHRLGGRVHCHELAMGRTEGRATFYAHPYHKMGSLLPRSPANPQGSCDGTFEVAVSTLDAFCREHAIPAIDVLKIDVEGFDLEVLKGAAGLLRGRAVRFIHVEFNGIAAEDAACGTLAALDALLSPQGFRFVCQYSQYVEGEGDFLVVTDALFVRPPRTRAEAPAG